MSFEGLKVITLISRDYHVIWNIKFTLNLIPTIYRVKSTLQIIYQKKKKSTLQILHSKQYSMT